MVHVELNIPYMDGMGYIPRTQLPSLLSGDRPSVLWVKSSKIWTIWVVGMYIILCLSKGLETNSCNFTWSL